MFGIEKSRVLGGGAKTSGDYLVRFFDIDGTILKEQYVDAGQDAKAPITPTYDSTYLTFAEWNQPFTNIQNDTDVGAVYDTIDGKTYLFVRITTTTGLQPALRLQKSNTALMTINWGDSSTSTSSASGDLTITKTSAYSAIGDYTITIECSGAYGVNSGGYILGNNVTYSNSLTKAYLGLNYTLLFANSFRGAASMKIISLSKNSGNIGFFGFQNCSALISIIIPSSITAIASNCFVECRSLYSAVLNKSMTTLEGNLFQSCGSLVNVVIPSTITTIGASFGNCLSLTKINIPNSVTSMVQAFGNCPSLLEVRIPNTVTTLGDAYFSACNSLRKVTISNSLTTIGNQAFQGCYSLTSLDFPSTLTTITAFGQNFNLCYSMLEYTFRSVTPPTLGSANAFSGINSACKIYVPDASVSAYKTATNWSTYANYIYPLSTKP
jgi:hypothetical protein